MLPCTAVSSPKLFNRLDVYVDTDSHSAAMNMAIDEALLESAAVPSIRFYEWASPALSFGYFGRFAEVASYGLDRDVVRRWTGGGIVFHGDDLTYSVVISASDRAFVESSMSLYERIHRALRHALTAGGERAELITVAAVPDCRTPIDSAVTGRRYRAAISARDYSCFSNPVRADVMLDGRKVAGAAQRRTRAGVLHQGSIQGVDTHGGLALEFVKELSENFSVSDLPAAVLNRAQEIAAQKYSTQAWSLRW